MESCVEDGDLRHIWVGIERDFDPSDVGRVVQGSKWNLIADDRQHVLIDSGRLPKSLTAVNDPETNSEEGIPGEQAGIREMLRDERHPFTVIGNSNLVSRRLREIPVLGMCFSMHAGTLANSLKYAGSNWLPRPHIE